MFHTSNVNRLFEYYSTIKLVKIDVCKKKKDDQFLNDNLVLYIEKKMF